MSESAALFQAIQADDPATVTDLIEARPDLLMERSPSGLTPLLFAAYYRRPQLAALLMGMGAGVSPFEAAAVGSGLHLLPALDADPALLRAFSPDGFTLLGLCAFFGHLELARSLLERGADPNTPSPAMNVTPLASAAAGDHTRLAELLLDAGADPDARQHGGYTPLLSAAQNGNAALLDLLVARGASPLARTDDGRSALDLAREGGHAAVVARLETLGIG